LTVWIGLCGNGQIIGPFLFDRNVNGWIICKCWTTIWCHNFSSIFRCKGGGVSMPTSLVGARWCSSTSFNCSPWSSERTVWSLRRGMVTAIPWPYSLLLLSLGIPEEQGIHKSSAWSQRFAEPHSRRSSCFTKFMFQSEELSKQCNGDVNCTSSGETVVTSKAW
jgi:hypothetical protein